ncbi:MAG: M23 family metallopeptidase [Myxococcales bacterium]|nr:M23 family metallopeptidase [Myxococcales bacterium]
MPRSIPRREKPPTERIARKGARKTGARKAGARKAGVRKAGARKAAAGAAGNRRVDGTGKGGGRAAKRREPLPPHERKARNRTVLLLAVLALINAYVFLWRGEGALASLAGAPSAVVGGHQGGPLPPVADPPPRSCTGDPVRIFEGLESLVSQEASLSRGLTLRLALLAMGIDGTEIDGIEANLRPHVDLGLLGGSGAPVRVAMDRLGGVRALEIELAEGHLLQACRDGDAPGGYAVRSVQHPLRSDVEVIALRLGRDADLHRAVQEAGEKPELAHRIAAELVHDVDLMTEARPDDEIALVVEKRWLGHGFHRYGSILALRFRGVATAVDAFRYKPEGLPTAMFDEKGQPVRRALLRSPVAFHAVPSEARGMLPPSLEVVEGHIGAAYRLAEGAPLDEAQLADGIVVALDRDADRGQYLELELEDGTRLRYAHLSRVIGSLDLGAKVQQGQLVGLAGHTGRTPHDRLRLEIWQDGETVDPMRLLAKGSTRAPRVGPAVPKAQLGRYEDDIAPRRRALRVARR